MLRATLFQISDYDQLQSICQMHALTLPYMENEEKGHDIIARLPIWCSAGLVEPANSPEKSKDLRYFGCPGGQ